MTVRYQEYEDWDTDEDEFLEKVPARCLKLLKPPKESRAYDDGWD
jgi:hypothetical protein